MTIQIEKLSDFLADLRRDTERMNHINHYPHLTQLYDYSNLALDLALTSKTMIDHAELYSGNVGECNIERLKSLLNHN